MNILIAILMMWVVTYILVLVRGIQFGNGSELIRAYGLGMYLKTAAVVALLITLVIWSVIGVGWRLLK